MARRSLLNRLGRSTAQAYRAWLRMGRKYEARIEAFCQRYAGSKVVNQMNCCKGDASECLCQYTRDQMIRTHVACFPHKITQFKGEWAYFKDKVSRPMELTVEDVRKWPYMIVAGLLLLWAGQALGRGSIYGYHYDDEEE